ncbi:MAG: hypothetical protein IT254_07095 [Chitinophagaceae bacterium]|nr:hypothetical protein [Chitinophagaceae bacterium]
MATKKNTGGSVASLQRTAAGLRKKIAAQNKKKRDASRVVKLKRTIEALKNKLKSTTKRATRSKR